MARAFVGNFCGWVIVCVVGVGWGLLAGLLTMVIGMALVSGDVITLEYWFVGWAIAGFIGANLFMGTELA